METASISAVEERLNKLETRITVQEGESRNFQKSHDHIRSFLILALAVWAVLVTFMIWRIESQTDTFKTDLQQMAKNVDLKQTALESKLILAVERSLNATLREKR